MSPVLNSRIRRFLRRFLLVAVLSLAGVMLIAYALDYVVFRHRMAANKGFGQVTVATYDAVQQKSGKTVFLFNPPQAQTCVNSLFPRAGYVPCWYLQRHAEQRTDI
ncbi:MAG TPA: hypothetical protein VFF50_05460 [Candidatus Deferrimicrobiaceae bacterium]|nr:hypothetical protein [Candidatus Deferrimicrobiaceae bacterium]